MLDTKKHIAALKQAFHMIDKGTYFMLALIYMLAILGLIGLLFACFVTGQLLVGFFVVIVIWILIKISGMHK